MKTNSTAAAASRAGGHQQRAPDDPVILPLNVDFPTRWRNIQSRTLRQWESVAVQAACRCLIPRLNRFDRFAGPFDEALHSLCSERSTGTRITVPIFNATASTCPATLLFPVPTNAWTCVRVE